jgi:hypothetical protein
MMDVVADDAPDKASPEYVSAMLRELRQFVNEHESNPSAKNLNDWSEHHSHTFHDYFGSWNNAVEAAGEDPNVENRPVSEEEVLQALDVDQDGVLCGGRHTSVSEVVRVCLCL